jgi:hypothetical protein
MLNELPLYTDLQKLLKDYANALEDAIVSITAVSYQVLPRI